jgi:excisionase family DNA binding protein
MNESTDAADESVSLSRAVKILGVCVRTVRREIDRRRLAAFRVGRNLRIKMRELRRYLQSNFVIQNPDGTLKLQGTSYFMFFV